MKKKHSEKKNNKHILLTKQGLNRWPFRFCALLLQFSW